MAPELSRGLDFILQPDSEGAESLLHPFLCAFKEWSAGLPVN
jgi:hypothetical protein